MFGGGSDLAVGTEVGCRNLKGDLIVSQFVHLFCQKVGLSHQGVGFHDLFPESRKALTKKLVSVTENKDHSFIKMKTCHLLCSLSAKWYILIYRNSKCKAYTQGTD